MSSARRVVVHRERLATRITVDRDLDGTRVRLVAVAAGELPPRRSPATGTLTGVATGLERLAGLEEKARRPRGRT